MIKEDHIFILDTNRQIFSDFSLNLCFFIQTLDTFTSSFIWLFLHSNEEINHSLVKLLTSHVHTKASTCDSGLHSVGIPTFIGKKAGNY